MGYDAKGVEPDESHARYAREELQSPIITGFANEINVKETFDVVTLHHVLEHMTDPLKELKKISTVLKENGYLIIEVPNAEDMRQDTKNRYRKAHLYTFNPETLIALGNKARFHVVKKTVASFNGNISVIFQKKLNSSYSFNQLANNYSKITNFLNTHTNFRHFASFVPYKKVFANALAAMSEQIAIRKFANKNDKDIIDSVISTETYP